MINREYVKGDVDAVASFISEAALVEASSNTQTPIDVLWEFPGEAELSSAPTERRSSGQRFPAFASAAAAIVLVSLAAAWFGSPLATRVRVSEKSPPDRAAAAEAASAVVPAQPAPSISSIAVRPLRAEPVASVTGATLGPNEGLRATAAPKPVGLSVASLQQSKALEQPTGPLGTSGAVLEPGRSLTARPMTAPAQVSPMVAAGAVGTPVAETSRATPAEASAPISLPAQLPPRREPEVFAEVASRTEHSGIQQVLGEYQSAYQRLDADAARAIWPSVDARALARAFDSLESQELAFDSCQVDVAADLATAQCRGSATFTPKIGRRGAKTESREWMFQLRKATDGWKIQTAQTKR